MTATLHGDEVARDPRFAPLAGVAGLAVQLRYATPDNFAGRVLYGGFDGAWLRREAAAGLARAVGWLAAHAPGHTLVVLDALRPQRVQEELWALLAGTPAERYLAHPARGSMHSFGMAVDVTLRDARGRELDMGSAFDEMHPRSHPALEVGHLARGELDAAQVANRQRLRDAMAAGGFAGIDTEWWHFDFGDRDATRRDGPRVL